MTWSDPVITVSGPKGELSRTFRDNVSVAVDSAHVTLSIQDTADIFSRSLWGTYGSHLRNMMQGVSVGFTKKLILEGVGFKVALVGSELVMALGFSHEVRVALPEGISATVEKNNITISGIDKDAVGQLAAYVRSLKKPEPYKGKGMRYEGEIIGRKGGNKKV